MTRDIWNIPAPYSDGDTSRAAAESLEEPRLHTLRRAVLEFIASREIGATDEEVQLGLGLDGNTERPRRWELVRSGLVVDSGERRRMGSGRNAVVWRAK